MKHPDLIGSLLLITRTGSTMREIGSEPLDNIGVYRIERDLLRLVVGTGPPSTEVEAHLAIHSKLSLPSSSVVHCHIGALLPLLEGSEPLPDWVRSVLFLKEGSLDLARASGEVAEANTLIIWRGHGIVSVSRDPSGALELIERAVSFAKNDKDHTVL